LSPSKGYLPVDDNSRAVRFHQFIKLFVVGDDDEGRSLLPHLLDDFADLLQGIDVQSGVDFIKKAERGRKKDHLQDLVSLLLASGIAFVEVPACHRGVQSDFPVGILRALVELEKGDRLIAPGIDSGLEEIHGDDTRDIRRILESHEEALLGSLVRREGKKILSVKSRLPAGNLIAGIAHQDVEEGALSVPVRAEKGKHIPCLNIEIDPLQDLVSFGFGGKSADFEFFHAILL
jgi:hypothetical protein